MMADKQPSGRTQRGRVRLELKADDGDVLVELDRSGFRRLLEALERLAESGEPQIFQRSGRGRPESGANAENGDLKRLIFRMDKEG